MSNYHKENLHICQVMYRTPTHIVTRVHKSIGAIAVGPAFTLRYQLTLLCPITLHYLYTSTYKLHSVVVAGEMNGIYHFIELTLIYDLGCAVLPLRRCSFTLLYRIYVLTRIYARCREFLY